MVGFIEPQSIRQTELAAWIEVSYPRRWWSRAMP